MRKSECVSTYYQPKTGAKCGCKRGVQRDNCPNCEGTGWVIDFRAIRERQTKSEKRQEA
jgi:hypothetical protein